MATVRIPRELAERAVERIKRLGWWETECGEDTESQAAYADAYLLGAMLAPDAPNPGLREAIARRMYADADVYAVSLGASPVAWEDCGGQQRWYYRRADSALAVLAERGMA